METQTLEQKFTENINGIMMPVNHMNNARFTGDWEQVKVYIAQIRARLDNLEQVADEQLSG